MDDLFIYLLVGLIISFIYEYYVIFTLINANINVNQLTIKYGKLLAEKHGLSDSYRSDENFKEFIKFLISTPKFTYSKFNRKLEDFIIHEDTLQKISFLSNYNRKIMIDLLNELFQDIYDNQPSMRTLMDPLLRFEEDRSRSFVEVHNTFSIDKKFNDSLSLVFNSYDLVNEKKIIDDAFDRLYPKYLSMLDKNDENLSELIDIEFIMNKDQYIDFYILESILELLIKDPIIHLDIINTSIKMSVKLNRLQYFKLKSVLKDSDMSKSTIYINEKFIKS